MDPEILITDFSKESIGSSIILKLECLGVFFVAFCYTFCTWSVSFVWEIIFTRFRSIQTHPVRSWSAVLSGHKIPGEKQNFKTLKNLFK